MSLQARPFPDRETLLKAVKEILARYRGTAVTVRQLYYRLVAAGVIPNNFRAYKNVCAALTKWRREGAIPISAFEDRTRGMIIKDTGGRDDAPKSWLKTYLQAGLSVTKECRRRAWGGP